MEVESYIDSPASELASALSSYLSSFPFPDNKISSDEFLDFSTVLLVSLAKKTDYSTFVEANFPSLFASNAWQTVCKTVKSKQFEYTIEWLLVLNAVLIAAQDYPQLAGLDATTDPTYREGNNVWEDLETVFTVIYVVECVLKITVNGWRTYIESPKNAFDFLITILVVLASMYVYCECKCWQTLGC